MNTTVLLRTRKKLWNAPNCRHVYLLVLECSRRHAHLCVFNSCFLTFLGYNLSFLIIIVRYSRDIPVGMYYRLKTTTDQTTDYTYYLYYQPSTVLFLCHNLSHYLEAKIPSIFILKKDRASLVLCSNKQQDRQL